MTPNGLKVTYVDYDIILKYVTGVSEDQTQVTFVFDEFTRWVDPRLAYAGNANVAAFYQDSRIDITQDRYNVWRPMIGYTKMDQMLNSSESMYLYPNGTIVYLRNLALTIVCDFQFQNIPSDQNQCQTVAYVLNEFSDTCALN